MKSNWVIKNIDHSIAHENSNILKLDSVITSILYAKGITTPEEIDKFINPRMSEIQSPFKLDGMHDAVARIKTAINNNETIGIFSDSDLDGLTSLSVLYELLLRMNIKPHYRFPSGDESYGLTNNIIDEFNDKGVQLLITVDSGIRDINEIGYAKKLGIDIIVTDHHEQDESLPEAIIINPKLRRCEYPFKHLAGVGVVFKLCHALLLSYLPSYNNLFVLIGNEDDKYFISYIKNGIIEKIDETELRKKIDEIVLSLNENDNVIFYNVDDIEALYRENDNLNIFNFNEFINPFKNKASNAKNYSFNELIELFSFNKKLEYNKIDFFNSIFIEIQLMSSPKIFEFINSAMGFVTIGSIADIMPLVSENRTLIYYGLKSLNKTDHKGLSLLINDTEINTKKIGWDIAPLLNTPGRFGRTDLTADFFIESDLKKLNETISKIRILNDERKDLVKKLHSKFTEQISNIDSDDSIVIIKSNEIPEGLSGLIANRLSDTSNKPTIVISLPGRNGMVKGSGRSTENFNFLKYVESFSHMFERLGGHAQAFGFTAKISKIEEILNNVKSTISNKSISEKLYDIDLEIDVKDINASFIDNLSMLEPFGKGNREPVFLSRNILIDKFMMFGNENLHGKYFLKDTTHLTAIGWKISTEMEKIYSESKPVDLIYILENNVFRGEIYPQMIILDMDVSN